MTGRETDIRLDVDGERLLSRLHDLAKIGRDPAGGISRPGFSPAADAANEFVGGLAEKAGLCATVDAGGNLIMRRPNTGGCPVLLLGSHLDTVMNGGWLDGAYGVIAALEVLQVVAEHDADLGFEVAAIAFANEEGALFPQPFWGSMVVAGLSGELPAHPTDFRGNPLATALARAGGDLSELTTAAWPRDSLLGYLELHIEQGPVLATSGRRIGVVDAIVGRTLLNVDIRGTAAHAGTTPMSARSDALQGAARLALAVDNLPRTRHLCRVATVGHCEVLPNSANTIAGQVRLTVDLRDADMEKMAAAETAVRAELATIATQLGLEADCVRAIRSQPARADPTLQQRIAVSAEEHGLTHLTLPSGAGHDAQIISRITPIGMIFVPSVGGVSHVPTEHTAEEDLVAGARVLLGTVLRT